MKQQSRSTGRSRPQTSIVGGFNIYHDDKNRTIYYNRLSKRAYIIKPNDFNTFRTYSMRIFLALAVIVVLFSFSDTFLANPLFAIGVGELVFVVLQVKFNGFLNRCTSIANFDTKHAYGYIQLLAIEETRRIWMKILLFTALAVLVVYNSYQQQYELLSMIITWLLALYAFVQVIFQFVALNYKHAHPDLDLNFLMENRPKDKKVRRKA